MDAYRVYLLDAGGRIAKALVVQTTSADEAVLEVEAIHEPRHGFEVWRGARLIARSGPKPGLDGPPPLRP